MTPNQRKNLIANDLLQMGVNKTAIIAMLCNAYVESGHTFSPFQKEWGGGGGYGIWQFTSTNYIVKAAVANMSEADAIKWECHYAITYTGQWIGVNVPMTFEQFLHNSLNQTWQELTLAWCVDWERPANMWYQGHFRQQFYNNIMPIDWGNSGGSNSTPSGQQNGHNMNQPPAQAPKKVLTVNDCTSLLNKIAALNHQDTQHQNNQTPPANPSGVPSGSGIDWNAIMNFYHQLQSLHTQYAYDGVSRVQVLNPRPYGHCDCSAFVSRCLEIGWHLNNRTLYNTETLHGFLKSIGYHLAWQGTNPYAVPNEPAGSVMIMGRIGTSLGAAGHTVMFTGHNSVIQCEATNPSIREDPIPQDFVWARPVFPNNWYMYVYVK